MKVLSRVFNPTSNRRLNELIGFLLCVSALLLFLALASYSPLDPSFNSASVLTGSHAARATGSASSAPWSPTCCLQFFGIGAFLLPVFLAVLGMRWFRSRKVQSPVAKSSGRTLADCVRACVAGVAARPPALDERHPDRRPARPNRRRRPDPLLEPRGRIHRLRHACWRWRSIFRPRSRSLSCRSGLPTRFAFADCAAGSLARLAGRAR